jgi:hypothetical protein
MGITNRPGGANVPPFDSVADIRKFVVLRDDFIAGAAAGTTGVVGELGWTVTQVSGDSAPDAPQDVTGYLGHPGVISFNTGPTTPVDTEEGALTLEGAIVLPDSTVDGMIYAASIVRFPAVTALEFYFGLFDLSLGAGRDTDSVSIELDISADTEFVGVSVAGSSVVDAIQTSTITAVLDTWYTLEIAADQGSAFFWVNGTMIGEVTGTNTALPLYPGFKMANEGSAEKSVLIDAFMLRAPRAVFA